MKSTSSIAPAQLSYIEEALEILKVILRSKNSNYRIKGEFSNFEFAADAIGGGMQAEDVMLAQIGIKLGRLKGLKNSPEAVLNESINDTIKDLAGYAVLLYAHTLQKERVTWAQEGLEDVIIRG